MNQLVSTDGLSLVALSMALIYAFGDGFRGAATIAATVVSTRALTPTVAFRLCAIAEFAGALLIGGAVASTISRTVIDANFSFQPHDYSRMLCIGLTAAFVWGMVCWSRGWPMSNGHALLAGMIGSALAIWGPAHVRLSLAGMVFLGLAVSPLIGFLVAVAVTGGLRWLGERLTVRARSWANGCHVMSCLAVATAHGSNEGQLVAGVLLPLALSSEVAPVSVRFLVALALGVGVLMGGQRILKKLSLKFYRIRDPQGLGAELTAAATIFAFGGFGFPASTSQVVAGSIIGAGVAHNPRRVKWDFVQELVLSWFITFPVVCLGAFILTEAFLAGGW